MADGGIFGPSASVVQRALDEQAIKREQDRSGAYAGIGTSFGQSFARGLMGGLGVDPSKFLAPEVLQAQQREQLQQGLQAEGIDPMTDPRAVQIAVKAGQYDLAQQLHTLQQQNRLGTAQLTQQEAQAGVAPTLAQQSVTKGEIGIQSGLQGLQEAKRLLPFTTPKAQAQLTRLQLENTKLLQELQSPQVDPGKAADITDKLFKNTQSLRKEANSTLQEYSKTLDSVNLVRQSLESETGIGDIAAIRGFLLALEPNSAVREGEFASVAEASGKLNLWKNLMKRTAEGDILPTPTREQFKEMISLVERIAQRRGQQLIQGFDTQAERFGMKPLDIVFQGDRGRFETVKEAQESPKQQSQQQLIESSGTTAGGIKYRIKVK